MDRGNIFSGAAFRATLYATMFLLAVCFATGIVGYRYIQEAQFGPVRERLNAISDNLTTTYLQSGEQALIRGAEMVGKRLAESGRVVSLLDANGATVAGRKLDIPEFAGSARHQIPVQPQSAETAEFFLTKTAVGPYTLVTGSNLTSVKYIEHVFLRTLMLITAFLTIVFITLGFMTSKGVQTKLDRIDDTLGDFAGGNLATRLPVSLGNDQIDRISAKINAQLDQLSGLMTSTKSNAAAIAHDLKRPLARAMLGVERAMIEADHGKVPQDTLEDIQGELANLNGIFESILRISRIDSGQGAGKIESVDLIELGTDLAETFAVVAEEQGQSLTLDLRQSDALMIQGDRGMITQMVVNLLQNAITHGQQGNLITLTLAQDVHGPLLKLCDTGPGIAKADRAHVFDAFYRAEVSRCTQGNGLGLTLVKSIADRHGATITLSDNVPGLCVVVQFPKA